MKIKLFTTIFLSCIIVFASAQIIHVPEDYSSIQAGINAASTSDTVLVAEGTYYENINFLGKAITVASHFILDSNETHIDSTVIDGSQFTNPDSASVVSFISNEDTTSIIQGFTIKGGSGLYNSSWQFVYGGGIVCWNAGAKIINNKIIENSVADSLLDCGGAGIGSAKNAGTYWIVINNNKIINNSANAIIATAFGGGIYVATNAIIKNNTIEQNSCHSIESQVDGGGIQAQEMFGNTIMVTIDSNLIQENVLEGYKVYGGGINLYKTTSIISNNIINSNSLTATDRCRGGGVFIKSATETIQVINNEITNNTLEAENYANGGGIAFRYNEGKIELNNNLISGNILTTPNSYRGAGVNIFECTDQITILNNIISSNMGTVNVTNGAGGGICLWGSNESEVLVDRNQFINNNGWIGGGFFSSSSYNLLLTNNIFSGNSSGKGGGIAFQHTSKGSNPKSSKEDFVPRIINNTFNGNTAVEVGGAVRLNCVFYIPLILNSIFWENEAPDGKDIYTGTANMTIAYSDIDTNMISGSWEGNGNIFEDPLFIDPENGDFHLDNCMSPCINSGTDSLEVNDGWFYCPIIDMDGEARPYLYTYPDMGADETTCLETQIKSYQDDLSSNILSAYPNPFKNHTTFEFTIHQPSFVKLNIVDFTGKEIQILVSERITAGNHKIEWNAKNLPSGIYFLRLETNGVTETRKLLIFK